MWNTPDIANRDMMTPLILPRIGLRLPILSTRSSPTREKTKLLNVGIQVNQMAAFSGKPASWMIFPL